MYNYLDFSYDIYNIILSVFLLISIYYIYILKYRINNLKFVIFTKDRRINYLTFFNKNLKILLENSDKEEYIF
jgi:hypothetical protein